MPSYNVSILGLEISFSTDADEHRIEKATKLLEERFERLSQSGRTLSREKLLTFLALSLADDYLVTVDSLRNIEAKVDGLVQKLDKV